MQQSPKSIARTLGIDRLGSHYSELMQLGLTMANQDGEVQSGRRFARDKSGLSATPVPITGHNSLLIIDIGGSHTKVALVETSANEQHNWQLLFDDDNDALRIMSNEPPYKAFVSAIAERISSSLHQCGVMANAIKGVGCIWSNAMRAIPLRNPAGHACVGIGGAVSGIAEEKSYRKGEWFTEQLRDDDDLAVPLLDALASYSCSPDVLLMSNDTVCTLKALPGAHAGLVISTGANATFVDDAEMIYNTEMGGLLEIPESMLSHGDKLLPMLFDEADAAAVTAENLAAGGWFAALFECHVRAAADAGFASLAEMAKDFAGHHRNSGLGGVQSTAELLSALIRGERPQLLPNRTLTDEQWELLCEIARALTLRGGYIGGALAYFSVANQLQTKGRCVIACDSTQARFRPGYFNAMQEGLNKLLQANHAVEIVVLSPENEITVPMRGLANAVTELLSTSTTD